MEKFEKIDSILYKVDYINHDSKKAIEIWNKIKDNKPLLQWAIKLTKDKFSCRDLVNGLSICNNILIDYDNIDKNVYDELIELIYSNEEIARIVINGASNGGYSFLLMSLWNHALQLTDDQKKFAEKEAMLKIGTVLFSEQKEAFAKTLDEMGISDNTTTLIDVDGYVTSIGQKTKAQYMNYIFSSLSNEQAHGVGCYDIRYNILKNPNWTIEEKQKLIYDFWEDNEEYDDVLDQWEWGIINDLECVSSIEKDYLSFYEYNDLLTIFNDPSLTKKVCDDIQFCKLMHQLRPQQWEIVKTDSKKLNKC